MKNSNEIAMGDKMHREVKSMCPNCKSKFVVESDYCLVCDLFAKIFEMFVQEKK